MAGISTIWNPQQALFNELIRKPDQFDEAMKLCLEMHALVHAAEMSHSNFITFEDELWEGLDERTFRTMPTAKDVTIAWNIWHLARIEDLTANILLADEIQVINSGNWLAKMNVTVSDTGNAMTDEEIIAISSSINMNELRNYRNEVGIKTRKIIERLKPADLQKKIEPLRLKRIFDEGGVVEGSKGLLDFWGRKTVAGILQMPITRHQIVHINDSLKLKEKCKRKIAR